MRRTLAAFAAASIMVCGACAKQQPTPKPTKQLIDAKQVQLCIDLATRVRFEEHWCTQKQDGYTWVYVLDDPTFPAELPAVAEVLQGGQARLQPETGGAAPVLIPAEGAVFRR